MNFIDVVFFTKLCETDFEWAVKSLAISETEAMEMLSSVQSFVGGQLFNEKTNPSSKNLTEKGKIFLPAAKKMVSDLLANISNTSNEANQNIIKVKADILGGKNVVLSAINDLERGTEKPKMDIEMFTYEDNENLKTSDMHVIFHSMEKADNILFEKRWSLRVDQGLYASKEYLQESGNIPTKPEDLFQHAILGIGDTFDRDIYSYTNWHLSGKYMNIRLNPSMMINSKSVLIAAISAHLGIGPLVEYKNILTNKELVKVLSDIKGPPVIIDFAVRKNINEKYLEHINSLEQKMLNKIDEMGLEVIY